MTSSRPTPRCSYSLSRCTQPKAGTASDRLEILAQAMAGGTGIGKTVLRFAESVAEPECSPDESVADASGASRHRPCQGEGEYRDSNRTEALRYVHGWLLRAVTGTDQFALGWSSSSGPIARPLHGGISTDVRFAGTLSATSRVEILGVTWKEPRFAVASEGEAHPYSYEAVGANYFDMKRERLIGDHGLQATKGDPGRIRRSRRVARDVWREELRALPPRRARGTGTAQRRQRNPAARAPRGAPPVP
jgi:hypothetical protein